MEDWRSLPLSMAERVVVDDDNDDGVVVRVDDDAGGETCKSKGVVSIAERRAAKCGFNAVSINTARFRSTSPLASPGGRSPYLTIPSGISPTALLDSPVMLHDSQALPSPTTGTFSFPPFNHENVLLHSVAPPAEEDERGDIGSFRFKPHGGPLSMPSISGFQSPMNFEFPTEFPKGADTENCASVSSADGKVSKDNILNSHSLVFQQSDTVINGDQMPQHRERESIHEEDQKGAYPPGGTIRTSEDGYNWRKYGQKQVKGSEFPRSYFKCTHPNCPVKKKVERSYDGQITEIIYKGAHNHPKPQPNRRPVLGSPFSVSEMSEMGEGGPVWRNIQLGCKDMILGSDWRADGLERERTSSASVVTEISDPLSTTYGKSMGVFESVGTPELSSTLASHADDDDDETTKRAIFPGDGADDEELEAKRMRRDSDMVEANLGSRAVREPRVVVQIESDVDILDDGYRWRKYGQKKLLQMYKCWMLGKEARGKSLHQFKICNYNVRRKTQSRSTCGQKQQSYKLR